MVDFVYKGRSARGELVSGRLSGSSADAVAARLINTGVTPVEIRDAGQATGMTVGELWRRMGGGRPNRPAIAQRYPWFDGYDSQ